MTEHDALLENYLESDQLAEATSRPLPRARLGWRKKLGLWALRVFVVAVSAMVVYVFFSQLS